MRLLSRLPLLLLALAMVMGGWTMAEAAEAADVTKAQESSAQGTAETPEAICLAGLTGGEAAELTPALQDEEAETEKVFLVPTNPCFRPPPPPPGCFCNGCCENCRCWRGGIVQKCVDRS
ncbi:MAG: hypothetical protein K0U98_06755 [Deltaproteobacteria bacterium]|nr:hypothetical protein [Deltaproteobacteria bacterium]